MKTGACCIIVTHKCMHAERDAALMRLLRSSFGPVFLMGASDFQLFPLVISWLCPVPLFLFIHAFSVFWVIIPLEERRPATETDSDTGLNVTLLNTLITFRFFCPLWRFKTLAQSNCTAEPPPCFTVGSLVLSLKALFFFSPLNTQPMRLDVTKSYNSVSSVQRTASQKMCGLSTSF